VTPTFLEGIRKDTKPAVVVEFGWNMTLPGLCAHECAMNGGQPVCVPRWDE
jgi:hypothetical protein